MKDIAVEKGLSHISDYLKSNGYNVSEMDNGQKSNKGFIEKFDAIVLSDMDNDFMGIENTSTKVPVIIAAGLRPDDIKSRIESARKS